MSATLETEPSLSARHRQSKTQHGSSGLVSTKRSDLWIEVLTDIEAVAEHCAAWQDLAANAAEPNPFYEPWMFLPAWEAFGNLATGLRCALIWDRSPDSPQPAILVGFAPLKPLRGFGGLPVRLQKMWQHDFCYLCAPLVRRGVEQEVLNALLDWAAEDRQGLLELRHVPNEGPLAQTMLDVTNQRGSHVHVVERFNRKMLQRAESFGAYVSACVPGSSYRDSQRRMRSLASRGRLETRFLSKDLPESCGPKMPADVWIRDFMRVEAAGWKGREKSALNSHPASQQYFENICRAGFERGQMTMIGLYLDNRPVAMCCNLSSGEGAFAFKTGFDEEFGKYSPGILVEFENIRLFHERPVIRWIDSCAGAHHSALARLWNGQRTIQKLLISPGRWWDNIAIESIAALAALRRACRPVKSRP